jgi:hypothetical protein
VWLSLKYPIIILRLSKEAFGVSPIALLSRHRGLRGDVAATGSPVRVVVNNIRPIEQTHLLLAFFGSLDGGLLFAKLTTRSPPLAAFGVAQFPVPAGLPLDGARVRGAHGHEVQHPVDFRGALFGAEVHQHAKRLVNVAVQLKPVTIDHHLKLEAVEFGNRGHVVVERPHSGIR